MDEQDGIPAGEPLALLAPTPYVRADFEPRPLPVRPSPARSVIDEPNPRCTAVPSRSRRDGRGQAPNR